MIDVTNIYKYKTNRTEPKTLFFIKVGKKNKEAYIQKCLSADDNKYYQL